MATPLRRPGATNDDDQTAALLAAAGRLLAEEGPEALTVQRIAAQAGVSTMGVYSRFGGKDGVVEALYRQGFERVQAALEAVPVTDDHLSDLAAGCEAYRRVALDGGSIYALMFSGPVPDFRPTPDAHRLAWRSVEVLVSGVRRALDAQALEEGDPEAIAHAIWGTAHGLVSLELLGLVPGLDAAALDARFHGAIAALLAGLAAR